MLEGGKRWVPKQESPQELETIARKLHSVSNITLIIEEAEQYIGQSRPMLPYTSALIRMGRNWGVGVWTTTRRIQDINKRFFDLCQRVFFYRCGLKSRDYIADMIGSEYVWERYGTKYNKTGYTLTSLPPWHAIHFDLEKEAAQIITLKMGAREHVETKGEGKKGEIPEKPSEQVQRQPSERLPKKQPVTTVGEQTEQADEKLWTPRRRQGAP